jgi:hypothetical protein
VEDQVSYQHPASPAGSRVHHLGADLQPVTPADDDSQHLDCHLAVVWIWNVPKWPCAESLVPRMVLLGGGGTFFFGTGV